MKKLKLQLTGIIILAAVMALPTQSVAQWSVGLSYQIREDAPKYGYGIRIEREILQQVPLVELGLRAHFAFFNEENQFTRNNQTFSSDIAYYDYGISAYGGISVGFFKPYIGLGIGASTIDFDEQGSESVFSYSGFVGIELTPIPRINPFIEYRLEPVDEAGEAFDNLDEELFNSDGRLILGVSISF